MSSYAFAYTRTARAYELTPDGQDLTRGLVRELYAGGVFFFCIFFYYLRRLHSCATSTPTLHTYYPSFSVLYSFFLCVFCSLPWLARLFVCFFFVDDGLNHEFMTRVRCPMFRCDDKDGEEDRRCPASCICHWRDACVLRTSAVTRRALSPRRDRGDRVGMQGFVLRTLVSGGSACARSRLAGAVRDAAGCGVRGAAGSLLAAAHDEMRLESGGRPIRSLARAGCVVYTYDWASRTRAFVSDRSQGH